MPSLRDLYLFDARLSYLEQILAALGLINPVDPAPSDISRLGGVSSEAFRRPGPIVDPAVTDRVRLAESLLRRPPQGDPAATDRVRLAELLLRRPHPGDPAVTDRVRLAELLLRRPPHGDPPPEDIARLTVSELETTLRTVAEDVVRLSSIETLLRERLNELREQSSGEP